MSKTEIEEPIRSLYLTLKGYFDALIFGDWTKLITCVVLCMEIGINSIYIHTVCFEVQVSVDEIRLLTEGDDPYDDVVIMKKLHHYNLKLLLVTEGARGCRDYTKVLIHNKILHDLYSAYVHKHNAIINATDRNLVLRGV